MKARSRPARRLQSVRRGFTLGELVVALALLSSGALAVVAASAAAVRTVGAAEAQAGATAAGRNRVEQLAAGDCFAIRDGMTVDSARALTERWTAEAPRNGARLVIDSVVYADRYGSHSVAVLRLVMC